MKNTILTSLLAAGMTLALVLPSWAQDADERRGWLGITYAEVIDGDTRHVQIERVFPRSPAAEAGVLSGDRVVSWNGSPEVRQALRGAHLEPGDTIRLRVRRQGAEERSIAVVVGPRPISAATVVRGYGPAMAPERWGRLREELQAAGAEMARAGDSIRIMRLQGRFDHDSIRVRADSLHRSLRIMLRDSLGPRLEELTQQIQAADLAGRIRAAEVEGISHALFALSRSGLAGAEFEEMNDGLAGYFGTDQGLLVLRVAPETPAARAGLQAGDVVLSADGEPVRSVAELRARLLRAPRREGGPLRVEILRRGARHTLELDPAGRVR